MSNDSFEIICPRCRAEVPVDAEECGCGHELIARPSAPPKRPRVTPEAPLATPSGAIRVQLPQHLVVAHPDVFYRPVRFAPSSYAGFWIRFVAWVIDSALILGATFAVAYIAAAAAVATAVYLAGPFLYYPLMESSGAQGTIRKLACGVAVGDLHGRRISVGRAYARVFGRILCQFTFGIGYLMIAFTERKQGLHDLIARTLVVNRGTY